jgi:hypothetical protein
MAAVTSEPAVPPAASAGGTAPAAVERVAPRQPAPEVERPSVAAPQPPSEAALLQRAQHLASAHPDDALRALEEHARLYPRGVLTPEREVLAIQILRAESRSAEATQHLNAFRARYPKSVYLERLEHSAAR